VPVGSGTATATGIIKVPVPTGYPTGTGSVTKPTPPEFTGAAAANGVPMAAAGILAAVAYLL